MERRWLLLLTSLVLSAVAAFAPLASANAAEDAPPGDWQNGRSVTTGVGPGGVDIGASETSEGASGGGLTDTDRNNEAPADSRAALPDPRQITDALGSCRDPVRCRHGGDVPDAGTPALTLTDLASFAPTTPTIHLEPGAFLLRGLPANAVTDALANEHAGTLLGHPITVRFTPTTHTWDWGDGTTTATTTAGRTWNDLDVPRFSTTDTSHVYTDRGSVTVTVTTTYAVDYAIDGGPWHTVTGTVPTTATTTAYVGTASTVIVPEDCNAAPHAVGC